MGEAAAVASELRGLRDELRLLAARVDRALERLEQAGEFELVGNSSSEAGRSSGAATLNVADSRERELAAEETGHFFLRCLRGEPRGNSGRCRVKLQNRVCVVIRAHSGAVHTSPVLVFRAYSEAKRHICHPKAEAFGDSIFAGFPSLWEARLAVATAGFDWPADQ